MTIHAPNEASFHFVTNGAIGASSEVWMYRQLLGSITLNPILLCHSHQNKASFPLHNIPSHLLGSVSPSFLDTLLTKTCIFLTKKHNYTCLTKARSNWIQKRIATDKPSCVLFQYGTTAAAYADLYIQNQIPIVVHFHGYDLSLMQNVVTYTRKLRQISPSVSKFVVVADYMIDALERIGVPNRKIERIPYGVPLDNFQPSKHLNDNHCKFLMTGRLVDKKSPLVTLEAFASCKKQFPSCSLTIIGDGHLRNACEAFVKASHLTDCVSILGSQSPEIVREEMSSASVFLQHSVTAESGDKEGWPVAIAEAAASSLPIVSTRHASIPEQVLDGKTGFIVNEHDSFHMANRMLELAKSPDLRVTFGRAARKHISQWDQPNQVGLLVAVIKEAMSSYQNYSI